MGDNTRIAISVNTIIVLNYDHVPVLRSFIGNSFFHIGGRWTTSQSSAETSKMDSVWTLITVVIYGQVKSECGFGGTWLTICGGGHKLRDYRKYTLSDQENSSYIVWEKIEHILILVCR